VSAPAIFAIGMQVEFDSEQDGTLCGTILDLGRLHADPRAIRCATVEIDHALPGILHSVPVMKLRPLAPADDGATRSVQPRADLLTPEGRKHYLEPALIAVLAPIDRSTSSFHNAAITMVCERPLRSDLVSMVSALLLLWKCELSTASEHANTVALLLDQLTEACDIADDAARSDIETSCALTTEDGREPAAAEDLRACWYDLTRHNSDDAEHVAKACAYLDRRGLMHHHPVQTTWVRFGAPEGRKQYQFPTSADAAQSPA
jgi:hypothetical protein